MSSISWKWNDPFQSGELGMKLCAKQVEILNPRNNCRRSMGLALALSLSATAVATAVAALGEAVIKGLGNVFACCCIDECRLVHGGAFLFMAVALVPSFALFSPFVAVAAAVGILVLPFWAAISPDSLRYLLKRTLEEDSSSSNS